MTITHEHLSEQFATVIDRLDRGERRFDELGHKLDIVASEVASTKELVEAWAAVKVFGKFLKWLGGVLAAIGAIYIATRAGVAHMLNGAPQ